MRKLFTFLLSLVVLGITAQTEVFKEQFNACNGKPGWSGNAGGKTFTSDNSGWTHENGYSGDGCIKLGTGTKKGSATTPAITLSGPGILTFKAGAWNNDATDEALTLKIENGTTPVNTFTLNKAAWGDYSVEIFPTSSAGPIKITFEASSTNKNRFFLDDVVVTALPSTPPAIQIGNTGYATYYTHLPFTMPAGLTGLFVTANPGSNTLTLTPAYQSGASVPPYTALLIKGSQGSYQPVVASSPTSTTLRNQLRGSLGASEESANAGQKFYILANDPTDGLGFYWDDISTSGDKVRCEANKCFLVVTSGATPVQGFSFENGGITAISAAPAAPSAATPVYDLGGRRVGSDARGVLIVGGKKIVR